MASQAEEIASTIDQTKTELLAALQSTASTAKDINNLIARHRSEADKAIMDDLQDTISTDKEQALWLHHVLIHKYFLKTLVQLRKEQKIVEHRKTAKSYLEFIKDTQLYYRGFVYRLVTEYGIPELDAIASNFGLKAPSSATNPQFTPKQHHAVLFSCHEALIHLGDLSRYREEVLGKEDRNWAPAIGYYDLAGAIYPASGASHHQRAVIARHGGSHLRITYHLYRSLATEEPHTNAHDNLELEMKKIESAHTKGKLLPEGSNAVTPTASTVVGLFMLVHSRLYKGTDIAGDDELENRALAQLDSGLQDRSIDGSTLNKLVLVNIAAQYTAGQKFQGDSDTAENMKAFVCFLRFNIKTFLTLLHSLQTELDQVNNQAENSGDAHGASSGLNMVTTIIRRILPALRHYGSWMRSNIGVLVGYMEPGAPDNLPTVIKVFFDTYASTMTCLATIYNAESLPLIEYLLEEDTDTILFKPFDEVRKDRQLHESSTAVKEKFHTHGVERYHPNIEMLGRIRDLVFNAVMLALKNEVPFDLVNGNTFTYGGNAVSSEHAIISEEHQVPPASMSSQSTAGPQNSAPEFDALAYLQDHISRHSSSSSTSLVDNTTMENMVESIVGPETVTNGLHSTPRKVKRRLSRPRLSTHGFTYEPIPSPLPDYGPIGTPPRRQSGTNKDFGPIGSPPRPSSQQKDFGPIGTPPKATGNETSYGVIGTPTAQELARNLSQVNGYHTISSSGISSTQESSSLGEAKRGYVTHSPRNQPNIWGRADARRLSLNAANHVGNGLVFDDTMFVSSNILSGSTWNMAATPPNGQGRA